MKIIAIAMTLAVLTVPALANQNFDAAAVVSTGEVWVQDPAHPTRRERAAAVLAVDEYVPDLGVTVTEPGAPAEAVNDVYPVGNQPTVDEGYPAKQECDTCH